MSEEKKIFDKKFVHFMWDDSLEGKVGFYSDSIDSLIKFVDCNSTEYTGCVKRNCMNDTYPFNIIQSGSSFQFFYYDPNYECKRAYAQGKTIQCRSKGEDKWFVTSHPNWLDTCEYRVKPEKTWRPFKDIAELKQTWLAKNGAKSKGDLYEPFIWVRSKSNTTSTYLITHYCGNTGVVHLCGYLNVSLEQLFEDYTFLDGSPCGVLESAEEE